MAALHYGLCESPRKAIHFRLGSRNVGALARKPPLQVLTRFESGFPSRSNADGLTRSWIPPHSGFRVLHFETPKSTKVYFLTGCQIVCDSFQNRLQNYLHVALLCICSSRHCFNQLLLCHPSQPKLLSLQTRTTMSGEKDSRLLMGSPSASIAEKWFILSEGRSLTGRVSGTTSLPLLDSRTDKRG